MSNPIVKEYNLATGEEIEREMTAEEFVTYKADKALHLEKVAIEEARIALKTSAKTKLIAGEPLTEEEAQLLLGGN